MSSQDPHRSRRLAATRRGVLPVVLWAFGFATSLMLLGLWGRTVTVDAPTIEETAQTIVDSDLATERIHDWLEAGIEAAAGTDQETAAAIAQVVVDQPEFAAAVDSIIEDFVAGLFADPGEDPVLRIEEALSPLIPVAVDAAERRDVPVTESDIEEALDTASVVQLDTGEAATVATVVEEARAVLTRVVVIAAIALILSAGLALALADRRYAMLRTLATRVLLSATTYALLFQVAAWALDPDQGREPVLGGGSVLLGSNGHVFLIAAGIAAPLGVWGGVVAWRRAVHSSEPVAVDEEARELISA